jgi:hypothetical protein
MSLVKQELPTLLEHFSSLPLLVGIELEGKEK